MHNRRSIRLKGYDYSKKGLYFITLCTQYRKNLFGRIEHGKMILNEAGKMINEEWQALTERYSNIILHEFIVMPNHFHSILEITNGNPVGAPLVGARNGIGNAPTGTENTPKNVGASLVDAPSGNIPSPTPFPNRPTGDSETGEEIDGQVERQPQGLPQQPPPINPMVRAPLVGAPTRSVNAPTLGNIIGAYKSITTVKYIENVKKNNWKRFSKKLWQRNYWEHIIRNYKEYRYISQYIINNPQKWQQDKFYK